MSNQRVTLERIDYASSFRFTRLFGCFRMATHPSRLLLALLLIVSIFIAGQVMDLVWGPQVLPGEFQAFAAQPSAEFVEWREQIAPVIEDDARSGIFATALQVKIRAFEGLVMAAVQLRPGFGQLRPGGERDGATVIGSLFALLLVPAWLWNVYPLFLVLYLIVAGLLWSLLGGAISRQTVLDAAREKVLPASDAVRFSFRRWGWFILAPAIPLLVVGGLALLLAIAGFILFNVPVLDIFAALIFGIALAAAGLMALILIGWFAGVHLMYPALAAEGTDAFDAMSRAFSYVFSRPWRMLIYSGVALLYGGLTYLFVGFVIFLALWLAQWTVGAWVVRDAAEGVNFFHAVFPEPQFGQFVYAPDHEALDGSPTGRVTAVLLAVWVHLFIGLVAAYAISFYFASYSVIYLMLRRFTDGTDTAEVYLDDDGDGGPGEPAEKVEPTPPTDPTMPGGGTSAITGNVGAPHTPDSDPGSAGELPPDPREPNPPTSPSNPPS